MPNGALKCPCGARVELPEVSVGRTEAHFVHRPGAAKIKTLTVEQVARLVSEARDAAHAKKTLTAIADDKDMDRDMRFAAKVVLAAVDFLNLKKFSYTGLFFIVWLLVQLGRGRGCSSDEDLHREAKKMAEQPTFKVTVNVTVQNGPQPSAQSAVEKVVKDSADGK